MWFKACRRVPQLFALWEQGRGPGQRGASTTLEAPRQPCKHRGELLRTLQCPTCRSQIGVKLFACFLHEECTVAKQFADVACCGACRDHEGDDPTSG